jgi:protein-disulfide isomerase
MIVAALLIIAMVAASMLRPSNGARLAPPTEPIGLEEAAVKGIGARHVMVEFSDFECPFCGRFARETLPLIQREYVNRGLLAVAFRHVPYERRHQFALKSAEAAECARRQNRFWPMHDLLFAEGAALDDVSLRKHARAAALDLSMYDSCMAGEAGAAVRRDMKLASVVGIRSTPLFFFGEMQPDGRVRVVSVLAGAQPFGAFKAEIDRLLGAD